MMLRRLMIALVLACATGRVHAQGAYYIAASVQEESRRIGTLSPTEKRFNAITWNNIFDYVYLKNGKACFELRDVDNYKHLAGIDTLLERLQADLAFYRDSLESGISNLRIDYSVTLGKDRRELRVIKYPMRGQQFVIHDGTTERLKTEQDTIRIVVHNVPDRREGIVVKSPDTAATGKKFPWVYEVQVTFLVNSYKDIAGIIEERAVLAHAMDTLASVRSRKEREQAYSNPSSCIYRPYAGPQSSYYARLNKFPTRLRIENGQLTYSGLPHRHFAIYGNMGVGLVRSSLSPNADLGITYLKHADQAVDDKYWYTSIYASPWFFFSRGDKGQHYVHDNWFVTLESGNSFDDNMIGLKVRGLSMGGSYLLVSNGAVFKGTTVKVFMGMRLASGITISPELYATDNFKQVFPAMSMRLLGFKREAW